jgi:L,D-transpeptidase ErfK/SrfK
MKRGRLLSSIAVAFCVAAIILSVAANSTVAVTTTTVVVDKSFHMTLISNGTSTMAYPNATGTTGDNATPVGTYKVINKQADPHWHWEGRTYDPYLRDQQNGLGLRWIGISLPSYGMHGTNEPFSIGKDISHGCVRHQNRDVVAAFPSISAGASFVVIETPVPPATEAMITDFLELYDLYAVLSASRGT